MVQSRYIGAQFVSDIYIYISNEEAHIVWTHLATHGDSSYLLVELTIESEGVEGQHKFCKTRQSHLWGVESRALVKEISQCFKTIVVGDYGVQGLDVHGVQEMSASHSVIEMEVSKDLERVVSVFYVGVKGAYRGGDIT